MFMLQRIHCKKKQQKTKKNRPYWKKKLWLGKFKKIPKMSKSVWMKGFYPETEISHVYSSFLESNSPDILALCETKIGWLSWFWQFLCKGLPSLIWKDSITHMHGLAVYVNWKKDFPFAWDLSLENSNNSYLCFGPTLLHSVLLLFPLWVFAKILSQKNGEHFSKKCQWIILVILPCIPIVLS